MKKVIVGFVEIGKKYDFMQILSRKTMQVTVNSYK